MVQQGFPPKDLIVQWKNDWDASIPQTEHVARQAAAWAADQRTEVCCKWVREELKLEEEWAENLRNYCQPKPPSLKKQALQQLRAMEQCGALDCNVNAIRKALESMSDE